MKFSQMPYERADLKAAGQKIAELAKELKAAKSGEEQFEIHKKYYELCNKVNTMSTIAQDSP